MNEFEDFRDLVRRMRSAQKKYFATRDKNWLIVSKELESQVDNLLVHYSDVSSSDNI